MNYQTAIEQAQAQIDKIETYLKQNTEQVQGNIISPEAEEALLGSILINPDVLWSVKAIVKVDDFWTVKYRWIYAAILHLHSERQAIDNISLVDELNHREQLGDIGGLATLTMLINNTPTHVHALTYAKIIERAAVRRRWIGFASIAANAALNGSIDTPTVNVQINDAYRDATSKLSSPTIVSGKTLMDQVWQNYEEQTANPASVRGMSTNISQLDQILMGVRPGLYAVGGASSMGKSTFAGGLAYAFAEEAEGVVVPTEVKATKALEKIATNMAGITYKKYLSGWLTEDEHRDFQDAFSRLSAVQHNFTFVDTEKPDLAQIEAEIIRINAKWLLIDSGTAMAYQMMMALKGQTDLRKSTTYLCQWMQNIARSGVAVFALWQTGRNAKERQSKIPRINDFKETGAIEETADVCMALYRHDYYVKRQEAQPEPDKFPPGTGKVYVLKDRDGGDGDEDVTLGFKRGFGFTNYVDPRLNGQNGF